MTFDEDPSVAESLAAIQDRLDVLLQAIQNLSVTDANDHVGNLPSLNKGTDEPSVARTAECRDLVFVPSAQPPSPVIDTCLAVSPKSPPSPTVTSTGVSTISSLAPLLPPANLRWYVITKGTQVGVVQGWENVSPHVIGVPSACFCKYPDEASAQRVFSEALAKGVVQLL